jgi:hypothetical protein
MGGPPGAQLFMRSFKAYSPAFFGKQDINKGNKSKKLKISLTLL